MWFVRGFSSLTCVFAILSASAETEGDWSQSFYTSIEVSSAFFSLGRVCSEPPPWYYEVDFVQRLSSFGHILVGYWSASDLDNGNPSVHRAFIYESDPYLFYGYDWKISEDWQINQQVGQIWVTCPGYREKHKGIDDQSFREWTYMTSLSNPYLTPSVQIRVVSQLGTYVTPAFEHRFRPRKNLMITPYVRLFGGSRRWNRSRYGDLLHDRRLTQGLHSVAYGIKTVYALGSGFSVYADLTGYDAFRSDTRAQLKAKHPINNALRDACFITLGVSWEF